MNLGKIHELTENTATAKLFFGNMKLPKLVIPTSKSNSGILMFEQDRRDRIEVQFMCVETGETFKEVEYYLDMIYAENKTQSW